jgi:cell division transport system ATP-binding protein
MISLVNAGKEYRKNRWALQNATFSIQKGELVFMTGPSGSGKTTLLKLISFEERPTTGEVAFERWSSRTAKNRELPYLRRRIGLVFQDFRLLRDRSAYENVAFVLRATGTERGGLHRRVVRALAAVGLAGRADAKPDELSGGEQQRVGIARAIVSDPFVVLADEPTGNLDDATKREIFQLLKKVSQAGTAVLIATHDVEVARGFRARTIQLQGGRIVEDRHPAALEAVEPSRSQPPVVRAVPRLHA